MCMFFSVRLVPDRLSMSNASDILLGCPICLEKYSQQHPPIGAPACGHSICQPCGVKRNSATCVTCNENSWGVRSSLWKKNFALIDCIQELNKSKQESEQNHKLAEQREQARVEMEKKLADLKSQYENEIDRMSCGYCQLKERRERMKICCGCAGIKDVDSTGKGMEEKALPYTLCAFCVSEHHVNHEVINYIPFKVHNMLSSTASDGIEMVNSMDELCVYEAKKGAEQIVEWKEKLGLFRTLKRIDVTYRDSLRIRDTLKQECEFVCNASEDTLPSLRKLTKAVKESQERVSSLLLEVTKRENAGVFQFLTKKEGLVKGESILLYTSNSNIVICVGPVPDAEAIACDNDKRRVQGMAEYLRLEPVERNKRTRVVHRNLLHKGLVVDVNGKTQTHTGENVTMWRVVSGVGQDMDAESDEDDFLSTN